MPHTTMPVSLPRMLPGSRPLNRHAIAQTTVINEEVPMMMRLDDTQQQSWKCAPRVPSSDWLFHYAPRSTGSYWLAVVVLTSLRLTSPQPRRPDWACTDGQRARDGCCSKEAANSNPTASQWGTVGFEFRLALFFCFFRVGFPSKQNNRLTPYSNWAVTSRR